MDARANIAVVEEDQLSSEQKEEFHSLASRCFSDVTAEEVEEDFCRPSVARVLAYRAGELVAGAEVFTREVEYEGQEIALGGFGPFTREDSRGQGIGTAVCRAAMDYLKSRSCDLAFVSIGSEYEGPARYYARLRFYGRLGFEALDRPFIYANVRDELGEDTGGLIAPLCSQVLFETVLHGETRFGLTPEAGYW